MIRWQSQRTATGSFAPKLQAGDMRSHRIEERCDEVLALWEAQQDMTLDELRVALAGIDLSVANSTLHRFFARHGITGKKTGHAMTGIYDDIVGLQRPYDRELMIVRGPEFPTRSVV